MTMQDTTATSVSKPAAPRRVSSPRKARTLEQADQLAASRDEWIERHRFFYDEDWRYLRFLVPAGKQVLDLGCGTGGLLSALPPRDGVGIDFSPAMVDWRGPSTRSQFFQGDVEDLGVYGLEVLST